MRKRLVGMAGGVVDQGIWSLSNISLIIVAAKRSGLEDVGAMGVVVLLYVFALGLIRSATSLPLLIRFSASPTAERRAQGAAAGVASGALGAAVGVAFLLGGVLAGGRVQGPLVVVGAFLPLLVVQDLVRHVWLAEGRPWRAARCDLLWLAVALAGYPIAITSGGGATGLAIAWAAAGAVAGVLDVALLRLRSTWSAGTAFLRDHWDLTRNHLGECLLQYGSSVFAIALLGFLTDLDEVGKIRLGQSLVGPLRTLLLGVATAAVPQAVRSLRREGSADLTRFVWRVALGLAGLTALFTAALAVVPDGLGEVPLGDNWSAAQEVGVPLSLGFVALAACSGPLVGLRALQRPRAIVRCSVAQVVLSGIGFIGGAAVGDALGAAIGQSIGVGLSTVVWWRTYATAAAEADRLEEGLEAGLEPGTTAESALYEDLGTSLYGE